jgi:uncharacterized RDD family membrane protein YckC
MTSTPEELVMPYCKNCGSELPEEATYCPKCGAHVEILPKLRLASWGERFVAWIIDMVILGIIIVPIRLFAVMAWPSIAWAPGFPSWVPFVDFGTSNVVYFFYWMIMEGVYGQSLGKMFLGIKVTLTDGRPINLGHAALESVGKAFLLPLDCLLGWIMYPRRRQRIFNYISDTNVVRV